MASSNRGLFGLFAQRHEGAEHSVIGVMRIAAAGVWKEEHRASGQSGLRETQLEAVQGDQVREQHAEDRHSQKGDRFWTVSPDFPF